MKNINLGTIGSGVIVESILDQTFRDFELILICDNPEYEEGIAYVNAASQKDSRIRIINQENKKLPTAPRSTKITTTLHTFSFT